MTDITKEKYEFLLPNHPIRQIFVDIESYEKKMRETERLLQSGKQYVDKNEVTLLWMEVVTRKDLFKQMTLLSFEPNLELPVSEKVMLQKLFYELNGFQWKDPFGWIGQTANVARLAVEAFDSSSSLFEGLRVARNSTANSTTNAITNSAEGYVKEFRLPGHGCNGELVTSFASVLKNCQFLNLNWNIISAHISVFNLQACQHLKSLTLAGNELRGNLDNHSFQLMTNLRLLDLSFNNLSGDLPDSLFSALVNLEKLDLSHNQFTGELPTSLQKLTKLQELRLSHNSFSGELKEEVFAPLKDLTIFNASHNRLTKGLQALHHNTHLEVLQLQNNNLQERLHSNIAIFKKLEILYLQHNQLYGVLNEELCELKRLRLLNLSHNEFRGCLPEKIGQLQQLEMLLLAGNHLVGPVPLSFGQLDRLRDLTLFKSYPSELCTPKRAFNRFAFHRIYVEGPEHGVNSSHWDFKQVYGRDRTSEDDESVTIFSGKL